MMKNSRRQRTRRKRILIAVEGAQGKSEHAYFQRLVSLMREERIDPPNLVYVFGEGEPSRVLKQCNAKLTVDKEGFDCVYLVVDVDDHSTLNDVMNDLPRIAQRHKTTIKLLVTNPCFEQWLIWHIADQKSSLDRATIQKKARTLELVRGNRGKELVEDKITATSIADACRRARNSWDKTMEESCGPNPSSSIPQIFDVLGWLVREGGHKGDFKP